MENQRRLEQSIRNGIDMVLYEKNYYKNTGDWFNYFRINLELPKFKYGQYTESIDTGKRFEIRFNTMFVVDICDNISWYVCFKILGFGLSVTRQWSY